MKNRREHRADSDRNADDAVDETIRRRFRSCVTLPLLAGEQPRPTGFFEPPHTGEQLRLDVRPPTQ